MNEQADRIMRALENIGDDLIEKAAPDYSVGAGKTADVRNLTVVQPELVSPKELRMYYVTRALGIAAAAFLVIGAAVLLIVNWDKIAVNEPERQGNVTVSSDTAITSSSPEIAVHEVTPRMEAAWKLTNDYMYGLLFSMTGDEVKDIMRASCGAEPSSETPFEVPQGAEEPTLYIYDNMPVFSYNAEMGVVVSDTQGLTQVDYTVEAKSETDANTVFEDIKDKLTEMLGQSDSSDESYCSWDVMETGICFDLRKQDNNQVKFFMYNKYISSTKDDNLFEQITDTYMPEPFDSAENPLGNYDFYSQWQAKFLETDYVVEYNRQKYNEHRKMNEGIETPYTLFDSPNFYGFAKAVELTDEQIVEAIEKRNDFVNNSTIYDKSAYIFNETDISVLLNGDVNTIAQYFASEYSIVVGENVFSPWWLYYHTAEDYKAAGIPTNELYRKMISYEKLGMTNEAWKAFCKKVHPYVTRQDIQADEVDKLTIYKNESSDPLGDHAFELLEKYFYGEWKTSEDNGYPSGTLPLTYGKSYVIDLTAVFEYDDMYILTYTSSGGVGVCCIVRKDEPDVMYSTEVGFGFGKTVIAASLDDMIKYTERENETPGMNVGGEISALGEKYLIHKYGEEFKNFYTKTLDVYKVSADTSVFEAEGESWYLANGYTSNNIKRYLVAMSDNAVTLGVPYVRDSRELVQTPEYFDVTLTRQENGEWSVEYSPFSGQTGSADIPERTGVHKTFDVQQQEIWINERAGGSMPPYAGMCVCEGEAYDWITSGNSSGALIQHGELFPETLDPDVLASLLAPYIIGNAGDSENDIDTERMKAELPREWGRYMFDDIYSEYASCDYYRLNDEYLVRIEPDAYYAVYLYRRNDRFTKMSRIVDILWSHSQEVSPDLNVAVTTDFDSGECYLKILDERESLDRIKKLLTGNGADLTDCRFVTPDEERASWLPLENMQITDGTEEYNAMWWYENKCVQLNGDTQKSIYRCEGSHGLDSVFFDPTNDPMGGIAARLELAGEHEAALAVTERQEKGAPLGDSVKPYRTGDLLDLSGNGIWRQVNDNILIEEDESGKCRIWQRDDNLSEVFTLLDYIRRRPECAMYGETQWKLKKLVLISEYDSSADKEQYTICAVADKQYWEKFEQHINTNYPEENRSIKIITAEKYETGKRVIPKDHGNL